MRTRPFLLLILFFTFTLKSTGVSTQYFLQLLHRDCSDLQNNLQALPSDDLQQRLTMLQKRKYNLTAVITLAATISVHQIIQSPNFFDNVYHAGYMPIALSATIAGYYLYKRHEALEETCSMILAEFARRESHRPEVEQQTNAMRLAAINNLFNKVRVLKEKPLRQH